MRTEVIAGRHAPGRVSEHAVVISGRRQESDAAFSLWLSPASGGELPAWAPGAHIDVMLPADMIRQFSLCGQPEDRSVWQICVQRERNSRGGTAWLAEHAQPGMSLVVRGPRNNFPLAEATGYRFIAGGIGITPILPMIRQVDRDGLPWRMVYGGRHRGSMALTGQLARYPQVTLVPEDEMGLIDLDSFLAGPAPAEAVYCCGPEPLLEAVEQHCERWPLHSLHVERFSADPRILGTPAEDAGTAFEVVCARSGIALTVPPDRSILSVAEENGIDVVFSCTEGICGTCETAVLGGVPEHHDSLLTEEERDAAETMMICVSRCRAGPLILDL